MGMACLDQETSRKRGPLVNSRQRQNQNWSVNDNDRLVSHSTCNGMPQTQLTVIWIVEYVNKFDDRVASLNKVWIILVLYIIDNDND